MTLDHVRRLAPITALAAATWMCGGASSPTSTPISTPTPTPVPTPDVRLDTTCSPTPPPLYGFRLKVHNDQGWKKVLDSKPLVKDAAYCVAVGQSGAPCAVRSEDDPQFISCNNAVVGKAADTGRYGPTWTWNGQPCRGVFAGGDNAGCKNHESNQFLVYAFGPGEYMACDAAGVGCKTIDVE